MEFLFPRTFGQNESKERLSQALAQGRFPHALLVHGEAGLGQSALLLDLAQILSCQSDRTKPCCQCYPCRAFQNMALETIHYLTPLVKKEKKKKEKEIERDAERERDRDGEKTRDAENEEESLNSDQVDELMDSIRGWHEQPYGFAAPEKAMVRVPQTRELLGRLRYASDRGKARIVLVPCLEALNPESSNALLKILEEPPADVYFLIATENRSTLLPTLLSRCLHIGLSPLPDAEFREVAAALSAQVGKPLCEPLLPFAEGSPGVYLELLENGGEELLEDAAKFLSAATAQDWRLFADHAAGVEGLEKAAQLLHFLLRCVRVHLSWKTKHPGLSPPSLHLGSLDKIADLPAFATFLQTAYQAVKGYSLPRIALLGLFLEYETKLHK